MGQATGKVACPVLYTTLVENRAICLVVMEKYDDALKDVLRAEEMRTSLGLNLNPRNTGTKALVFYHKGDLESACRYAREAREQCLEYAPDDPTLDNVNKFIKNHCGDGE